MPRNTATQTSVTNSDIAYLAGIIDGEGSLGIYQKKDTNSFGARLRIAMNDPQAIKFLKNKFGGRSYESEVQDRNNSHIYVLAFERKEDINNVLTMCLPHLLVKKQQAQTVIDFLAYRANANQLRKDGNTYVHLQYYNFAKRCKSLKTRFWKKD
jgi:hypothetical protein